MKLQDAIKRVIECDGKEAIIDLRIINVLSDFQAYADSPSAKYVLRAMIADGYSKRLLALGSWGSAAQQLLSKFVSETGFQAPVANLVFQSIAYGLGWKSSVELASNPSPATTPPLSNPNKIDGSRLNKTARQINNLSEASFYNYKEAAEQYLESIIEFKTDFKQGLGVDVAAYVDFKSMASFYIRFEINGKIKVKYDYSIKFHVLFYNGQNKIICKNSCNVGRNHLSFEVCEIYQSSENYRRVCDITKIVVYWEL